MFQYSDELKQRLKTYFKEKYILDITDGQADEYLDSLANLYAWFEKHSTNKK